MNKIIPISLVSSNDMNFCQSRNSSLFDENINFKGKREIRSVLRWVSKNFSSPQQRATLGITALCTQPFIDLHNKHIKKEDKSVVVAKTISKIIIGTIVGVTLRHYAIKVAKNFTKSYPSGKFSQSLLPSKIVEKLKTSPQDISEISLNNYRNGIGTLFGVGCGLFTNFLIDAPLTKVMTNYLNDKVFSKGVKNGK